MTTPRHRLRHMQTPLTAAELRRGRRRPPPNVRTLGSLPWRRLVLGMAAVMLVLDRLVAFVRTGEWLG